MRGKLSLALAVTVASAAAVVALTSPAANALPCPPGTRHVDRTVAGQNVHYCVPGMECDPRPCDPTAAPRPE